MVKTVTCVAHETEFISDDEENTKCIDCTMEGKYSTIGKQRAEIISKTKKTCNERNIACLNFHEYKGRDSKLNWYCHKCKNTWNDKWDTFIHGNKFCDDKCCSKTKRESTRSKNYNIVTETCGEHKYEWSGIEGQSCCPICFEQTITNSISKKSYKKLLKILEKKNGICLNIKCYKSTKSVLSFKCLECLHLWHTRIGHMLYNNS